ncbi:50S ribosomal protein L23 [Alkalitalea saponilacus]|uniref:Large ribosomal subunit protein uL23 n=1 Tax=Alkalitalea saponilacus TaxID=889453 RepID=A0A1T5HQ30_9BACT|nr:50S ribosomal protein L23 [Alkalitalea saponilacus]ASB48478.1 50S ribosomal protein L23 [Alkalitalea saponilacus]SKC22742.1 large subunit ribosomal protein L23 [Alkalitalea saponilacus]
MDVIVKPIVTEKMTQQGEALNRYGFIVKDRVSKSEIKKAVEEMYDVTVATINTMRYSGKLKTRYTKGGILSGRTASYKKAIVTLAEGDKIDFYSNI